jgi:hypothetical protein
MAYPIYTPTRGMAYTLLIKTTMNEAKKNLNLRDMDVGLFLSYELSAETLTTKLFRIITLNTINLSEVEDLRRANEEEIPYIKRINWLSMRRMLCPIYTFKPAKAPRVFMRLRYGSHIELQRVLG